MALRIPRNQVQYDRNTPFYSGYDAASLIDQYKQGPTRSTMDAELDPYGHIGTNWRDGGNSTPMLRDGHMMLEPGSGGTYRLTDGRQVGPETPWDYFDSTGNYLGGAFHDSGKSGIHALMPSVVKALTTAMIGGGIAGAFGMGPMASSGGFFNPGTAGAGGAGGAGAAGGGWMSGVDGAAISGGGGAGASAPIFSSGGAASGFAGAGGAAGAGGGLAGVVPPNPYVSGGGMFGGSGSSSLGGLGSMFGGGGGSNLLGIGSTALGALSGGQGQDASSSSTRAMDPRMDALFYGDLAQRTQGVLGNQMGQAQSAGNQLLSTGQGLLGQTAPTTATNPYLQSVADDMQRRTAEMLGQNNLAIRGNAVASGGLGGSRQGVAEGIAGGRAADYLQGNLASLYGTAYNQDQNRLRQDWTIGSGLMNQGLNTPFQPLQNTAGIYSPFTGTGTTTNNQQSGGGWQGAVGGALAGATLGRQMGWW